MLGLGGYPLVSLAEARNVAFANRQRARTGGDPRAEKRPGLGVPTVEEAAAAVLAQQRPGRRNAKHARDWPRSLRAYAFPRIGAMPVSAVTTADVLAILTPIWHDKPETARRVRQRIGAVMKWAVARGNPPWCWPFRSPVLCPVSGARRGAAAPAQRIDSRYARRVTRRSTPSLPRMLLR